MCAKCTILSHGTPRNTSSVQSPTSPTLTALLRLLLSFVGPVGTCTCPRCGQAKFSFIKTRRIWFCYPCKKQFTVKVRTIMEDSPLGLDKWMTAPLAVGKLQQLIMSFELGRALGYSPELGMVHASKRIREAMKRRTRIYKFGGDDWAVPGCRERRNFRRPESAGRCTRAARLKMLAEAGKIKRGIS